MLVDLAGLFAEARAQGGEVAMQRLRAGLGGNRTVARAVGFAPGGTKAPAGFDLTTIEDPFTGGVQLAATALELLGAGGTLVLAPATPPMLHLAKALRAARHAVEVAGFVVPPHSPVPVRRLGRDCLFVP